MSWNGFPKTLFKKLVKQFSPKPNYNNTTQDQTITNEGVNRLPKIWIRLPYIGKRGNVLIRNFKNKTSRLLKGPCKIITNWDTLNTNCFVSNKDKIPKHFQSDVVYKFSCPGCYKSYIGKTERCLYTRIHEHTTTPQSEIHKHINDCELFQHLTNLLNLNPNELQQDNLLQLDDFILNNTVIIDKARHWSLLLFKEALAIRRQKPDLNHGVKASLELSVFN